jgi:tRNA(Arg) A34 adenosine deaminase TadA
MTTAISPAVTLDSHSTSAPCSLCGGAMTAHDDIDVCVCGSRRVRSQAKPAAASRDDVLRGLFAEHLHMLQEMTDVGDAWCVAEMARLDTVLNNG